MNFKNKEDLKDLLGLLPPLGYGSTSTVYYYPRTKKILKISNSFLFPNDRGIEDYCFDISRFDGVQNDTYVLPHEIVKAGEQNVGIIYPYVNGKLLYSINPQSIYLPQFEEYVKKSMQDTIELAKSGILSSDMPYNTMLSSNGIKVIDAEDYSKPELKESEIKEKNIKALNITIKDFLIADLFDNFVRENKVLYELYRDDKIDVNIFLKEFRNYLSEYVGKEVEYLSEAKKIQDAKNSSEFNMRYIRTY